MIYFYEIEKATTNLFSFGNLIIYFIIYDNSKINLRKAQQKLIALIIILKEYNVFNERSI